MTTIYELPTKYQSDKNVMRDNAAIAYAALSANTCKKVLVFVSLALS